MILTAAAVVLLLVVVGVVVAVALSRRRRRRRRRLAERFGPEYEHAVASRRRSAMPSSRRPPQSLPLAVLVAAALLPLATAADAPRRDAAPPGAAPQVEISPPLPMDTIVVRPEPAAPPARPAPPPETISLSLRDADLVEVLRSFARLGGFDLIVDPRVKGTVTVELRDVRWQAALAVILRTHGLAAEIDGRVVSIRPLPTAGGR